MSLSPDPEAADRRALVLVLVSCLLVLLEGALILASASPNRRVPRTVEAAASRAAGKVPAPEAVPASGVPAPPAGRDPETAARDLGLDALRRLSLEEAAEAGRTWARAAAADGLISERELASVLPSPAFILARTSPDEYADEIRLSAEGAGAFARAYGPIDEAMPGSNAAGARLEAALGSIHEVRTALGGAAPQAGGLRAPIPRVQRWIASAEDLKKTHRHALDIFFRGEGERGSAEKGPLIRSMSSGFVVAAADDWVGGEGAAKYRRGGLTPRAGNGAVVYDPATRRYYTYFHMHDVSVRPGQWVDAGEVLGRGGNTGTNARKRGHGGHLHLEIYEASEDRALDCWELRDLVLSL